jgi:hypothetical protein
VSSCEAQVRAYVGIRWARITFDADGHPRVEFVAVNSGQSPARDFTWNVTLRYGVDQERVCRPNWRRYSGFDIPADGESSPISTFVPNMAVDSSPGFFVARLKVEFRYTDVFDRSWDGDAYFEGVFSRTADSAQWNGSVEPSSAPGWDSVTEHRASAGSKTWSVERQACRRDEREKPRRSPSPGRRSPRRCRAVFELSCTRVEC